MKRYLTFFISLLVCLHTTAALRTIDEAMQLAASLDTKYAARVPARQAHALTHCFTGQQKNGQPAFYVFNRGEQDGFVLISAEDRTRSVLGYADEGHWDAANMSEATRAWLEMYSEAISRLSEKSPTPRAQAKAHKQYTEVSPICQTQWGQSSPYYDQCPMYNGSRCVTGCVATAAAQIMKVHAYPTRGTGSYSYRWKSDTGDSITLSVSPGTTTYDWSNMLNTYTSSATTAEKNAVATLMYHCGVVSEMDYSPSGSGASNNFMLAGMVNHFGYDPGVEVLIKDCMTEEDFISGIEAELVQGRPVMFSARTVGNSGHSFVGDGIDADGLIHINWGWKGVCDGFFQVSVMDPDNQGIGGSISNEAYTEQVLAYTHIQPDVNGAYHYSLVSDKVTPYQTSFNRSDNRVILQADVLQNLSIVPLYGTSALKVEDENGYFTTYRDFDYSYNGLPAGYYYYTQYFIGDISGLPNGNYYISPVVKINGTYVPVQVKGYTDYRCPMQVTSDQVYLTEPEADLHMEKGLNAYEYKEISAYYYPSESYNTYTWKIQLSTKDFYEDDGEDQALLMFRFITSSPASIVGTYLNEDNAVYRMVSASAFKGNINSYERVTLEDAEITIAYNSIKDVYTVYYYLRTDGMGYIGQADIKASDTWAGYGEAYGAHEQYETIILDEAPFTGITVSQAMNRINAHTVGWTSEIPYIVEGQISQLVNTPSQIVQYGNCRLYLSDGQQTIYGYNTKWLNNQAYPTGNEIAVGGKAAIIGKIKYYSASTKEIESGYFYHYEAPNGLKQTVEQEKAVQKIIRDGQILILRNGETYTVQGVRVSD